MSTLVLQMTARGVGAIAALLVAGAGACEVLEQVTGGDGKVRGMKAGQTRLVRVRAVAGSDSGGTVGEAVDEALLVRVEQERYELHVHGGVAVMEGVLAVLRAAGAEVIDAERAIAMGLLGGVMEGEVVAAAQYAVTEAGLRLLARQDEGGIRLWGRRWIAWLAKRDQAGGLWEFHSTAQWVLERSQALDRLLTPARVAIVGAPNVGKSTLANALLGRPMSITSAQAGTTRDWVDAVAVIGGNSDFGVQNSALEAAQVRTVSTAVVLVDTAGVRATPDPLEVESIARTHQQARGADVVVVVLDATRAATAQERELLAEYAGVPRIVVMNKVDIAGAAGEVADEMPGAVRVSGLTHTGLEELMGAVRAALDLGELGDDEPWAFTARQKGLLRRAAVAGDGAEAAALLRELIGEES